MTSSYQQTMAHPRQGCRRRPKRCGRRRIIGGVCAGLGAHFEIPPIAIRILFIIAFLNMAPLVILLYIIAWIVMPKSNELGNGEKVYKHPPPPPPPPGSTGSLSYGTSKREETEKLTVQFEDIEEKIRHLEDLVTSKEYLLRRKFADLESK